MRGNDEKYNMLGKRVGKLTVVAFYGPIKNQRFWECVCDCGQRINIGTARLKGGEAKSCGFCGRRNKKYPLGIKKSRLYRIMVKMRKRCYLKSDEHYKNYGLRGISICDEWKNDFMKFYDWAMANGYKDDLTIERIDVNGNYCPENCTWIPKNLQPLNMTNTIYIEYQGKKLRLREFAEFLNVPLRKLQAGYSKGKRNEELIQYARRSRKRRK